jgi:hypothetical protein
MLEKGAGNGYLERVVEFKECQCLVLMIVIWELKEVANDAGAEKGGILS